jgi:hypothetical protein
MDIVKKKKKIVINQEGETVEVDPEKPISDVKEAHVVTYQERRKRAINMRRRLPKIKRARELALKRVASKKKIKKRSQSLARSFMRRRVAGKMGASYQQLSPSDKIVIDKMISPKQQAILKLANRLAPSVKRAETARLLAGKRTSTYNIRPISAETEYEFDHSLLENIYRTIQLNEDLRNWFNPSHPEGGWKRINSKGEVAGPCAREPGEPKPKCMSNEKIASLSKKERAAAVAAKRKHDPNPERKGAPINVSNYGKGKLTKEEVELVTEKSKPTNPELWSRAKALARSKFDVYPSAYANGWAAKWYKSKGGGWRSVSEEQQVNENFLDGKNPQDKGDMKRHGLLGKSFSELKKIRSSDTSSKRQKQLAHWFINMHKSK